DRRTTHPVDAEREGGPRRAGRPGGSRGRTQPGRGPTRSGTPPPAAVGWPTAAGRPLARHDLLRRRRHVVDAVAAARSGAGRTRPAGGAVDVLPVPHGTAARRGVVRAARTGAATDRAAATALLCRRSRATGGCSEA